MKKVFSLLITLAMLISTMAVPVSASDDATAWDGTTIDTEWEGTGTEADPYLISSAAELAGLTNNVFNAVNNGTGVVAEGMENFVSVAGNQYGLFTDCYNVYSNTYFKLTADIDLDSKPWTPIGRHGARFNGNFNGNGHVIKNVSVTEEYIGIGLFGASSKATKISNLGLENFVATIDSGKTPKDVTTFGNPVNGITYVWGSGAMVGILGGGTFENCYTKDVKFFNANASVGNPGGGIGEAGFGGFAGNDIVVQDNTSITFKNCYVMNVESETADHSAGFWAKNVRAEAGGSWSTECQNSKMDNCYVAGEINLKTRHDIRKSGFLCNYAMNENDIDWALPTVTNCYTTGEVNKYDVLESTATKENIIENLSAITSFVADNANNPVNDGYPVLSWQADWIWDGRVATSFAGGTGTKDDPYLISNGAELAYLSEKVWNAVDNKTNTVASDMTGKVVVSKNWQVAGNSVYNVYKDTYFKLTDDIDLGNMEWQPIGRSGARFSGKFDGDGHVIKNVSINKPYIGIGLFGATGITAEIKNLGLENFNANVYTSPYGNGYVLDVTEFGNSMGLSYVWGSGAMVGIVGGGEFKDSYVKNATFINSTTYSGEAGFGGFAGNFIMADDYSEHTAKFTNCCTMNVTATVADQAAGFAAKIGGFGDGRDFSVEFKNCYAGGTLTFSSAKNETAGFACELLDKATLTNCYTTGSSDRSDATVNATNESITAGLANVDGWSADNATAPINGGYPVLDWQNTWKKPYEVKAVATADGAITAVTIEENAAVSGRVVIVAVYDGTRFVTAVTTTADAVDGVVALAAPVAYSAGNTVKVFVWDSMEALTPVADAYSTTL